MTEEEKIFAGKLFAPATPELVAQKLKSHNLSQRYSALREDQAEEREAVLREMVPRLGDGSFIQGPVFFHYGVHTTIGKNCFFNYNLTVQDDAPVTIGNYNCFGPNFTVVTPVHPMLPLERRSMLDAAGQEQHLCCARPVTIGNDCWFGANVLVCPGVTIGDNVVVGAGSVVTRDLPSNVFAAGVPCRVIREITSADSMENFPDILGDCQVIH